MYDINTVIDQAIAVANQESVAVDWQYNGVAPMTEILIWCRTALDDNTWQYNGWETIAFYNDPAWTMFRLRWL